MKLRPVRKAAAANTAPRRKGIPQARQGNHTHDGGDAAKFQAIRIQQAIQLLEDSKTFLHLGHTMILELCNSNHFLITFTRTRGSVIHPARGNDYKVVQWICRRRSLAQPSAASAAVAKLMKVEATDTGHLSPAHLGKIVSLEEGHLVTESDALQDHVSDWETSRDINCDRIRNTIASCPTIVMHLTRR